MPLPDTVIVYVVACSSRRVDLQKTQVITHLNPAPVVRQEGGNVVTEGASVASAQGLLLLLLLLRLVLIRQAVRGVGTVALIISSSSSSSGSSRRGHQHPRDGHAQLRCQRLHVATDTPVRLPLILLVRLVPELLLLLLLLTPLLALLLPHTGRASCCTAV